MKKLVTFFSFAVFALTLSGQANALEFKESYKAKRADIVEVRQQIRNRVRAKIERSRESGFGERLAWIFSGENPSGKALRNEYKQKLHAVLAKLRSLRNGSLNSGNHVAPAPQPAIVALMALGMALVGGIARRRNRARA